jgi:hypothetical protein
MHKFRIKTLKKTLFVSLETASDLFISNRLPGLSNRIMGFLFHWIQQFAVRFVRAREFFCFVFILRHWQL